MDRERYPILEPDSGTGQEQDRLQAPAAGHVAPGDQIEREQVLVELE